MDFSKAQFSNSQLAKATGLSSDTLQTWANRRLIGPMGQTGFGQRRLYSAQDVIHVRLLQKLMALGLPVSLASEMCSVKLDDTMLASIHHGDDRILMCISRAFNGYKIEIVNASKGKQISPEDTAGLSEADHRIEESVVVRVARKMAVEYAVSSAYLTVDLGEVVRETISALATA